jgi:hypothetical protein
MSNMDFIIETDQALINSASLLLQASLLLHASYVLNAHWTSNSPIAIGITKIYQTKKGNAYSFIRLSSRIFCCSDKFLANFCENSRVVGVHIVLLASLRMRSSLVADEI